MTVQSTKLNTGISNISWFNRRNVTSSPTINYHSANVVYGDTNRPERLNSNPDAGDVVTFDSYNCFGFEPTF